MGKDKEMESLAIQKLKEADSQLRKVTNLPDNMLYVSIYQNLGCLIYQKKYSLCIEMATALVKELSKDTV